MKRLHFAIWLLVILGVMGVRVPAAAANVTVQTDKEQYTTGEVVKVTVRNELTEPIHYYGMCALTDCMMENEEWQCENSAMCDAPQQVLLAGEEREFTIRVIGLIVGDMKYRFEYTTAILEQRKEAHSNPFFIISTGEPKQVSLSPQADYDPVPDGPGAPRVISLGKDSGGASGKKDNIYIARHFRNQDAPSNQKVVRQRKSQDRSASKAGSYGLAEGEVILSVSGVPKKMRRSLINVLTGEFSFIRSMEEITEFKGVVQYFIQLDINPDEFAEHLKDTRFSAFRLDIIRVKANHIDCRLKFE